VLKKLFNSIAIYQDLPKNIYFIALARLILGLGNFIIPFMVLLLTQKLGYSATIAGSLAMGVTGIFLLGNLVGGILSDSLGHKQIMVAGELIGALFLILCGFYADDPIIVPALLFASYFFFGTALPASNALVADLSTPNNRDAVMSLSYLAFNLGSAIGPVLAGYLFWNYTQWIFWGNGVAALVGILVVMFCVSNKIDTPSNEAATLENAVKGSVWSVLKERPRLIIFMLLCAFLWFSVNQMTMTSPLYLNHIFASHGPVLFGQLMTYACVLVVIITPILMRLTSNKTEIMSLAYAGTLFVLGYLLVMLNPTIPIHFFAWFFLAAAEVLLLTKEGVYLANQSPSSHRGRIQGISTTIRNIIVMPSFVLIGFSIDHHGYLNTWLLIIIVTLFSVLGLLKMNHHQKTLAVVEPA
jgi:MFS family permease